MMRGLAITLGLLGLWEWFARRARTVEVGVFAWLRTHIEPGDLDAFKRAGGTHVVVKFLDGTAPFRPNGVDEVSVWLSDAQRVGLVVEGWGWSYCRTVDEARAEGEAAARMCVAHGLRRWYQDAEHQWRDGVDPEQAVIAYAVAFRRVAPGVELAWSNFSSVPGATAPAIRQFDVWAPQCYGTTSRPGSSDPAWRRVMTARLAKGRELGLALAPIVTTGDVDPEGRHWSPWRGPDGVLAWARDEKIGRVNIWWGSNSRGRMQRAGRYAAPLVDDIALLARGEVA